MEAAIVSLLKKGFSSGIKLKVAGDFEEEFVVVWSHKMSESALATWKDENNYTSIGAVALAILLVEQLLHFVLFEESLIGTGIDFWMNRKDGGQDEITYSERQARLEVSGISKEAPGNTVNMRIQQKKKQIAASDNTELPGWIVIVEFATPKSKIIKK